MILHEDDCVESWQAVTEGQNMKMDLRKMGCEYVNCIHLASIASNTSSAIVTSDMGVLHSTLKTECPTFSKRNSGNCTKTRLKMRTT
jgi:hypothetical protein